MEKIYDLIIIGAGPAGITASIYAKRAMLNFLILEKWLPGGEIANTYEVENYPGLNRISGAVLADKMVDHAKDLGVDILSEGVDKVDFTNDIKKITTRKKTYLTKTVIIASGASPKKLGIPGEEEFGGRGVSYCAVCDGALYRDRIVAVVGGGDVAVEDAIYLSRLCKKVYIIHRRDELRAAKGIQEKMFKIKNIEPVWDSQVIKFNGDQVVSSVDIINKKTKETSNITIDAAFMAIGMTPNVDYLGNSVEFRQGNWVKTNAMLETSVKGVYAAGDVRDTLLRQVVTGVSDGAVAVTMLEKYL